MLVRSYAFSLDELLLLTQDIGHIYFRSCPFKISISNIIFCIIRIDKYFLCRSKIRILGVQLNSRISTVWKSGRDFYLELLIFINSKPYSMKNYMLMAPFY